MHDVFKLPVFVAADVFPMMVDDELSELVEDITVNGLPSISFQNLLVRTLVDAYGLSRFGGGRGCQIPRASSAWTGVATLRVTSRNAETFFHHSHWPIWADPMSHILCRRAPPTGYPPYLISRAQECACHTGPRRRGLRDRRRPPPARRRAGWRGLVDGGAPVEPRGLHAEAGNCAGVATAYPHSTAWLVTVLPRLRRLLTHSGHDGAALVASRSPDRIGVCCPDQDGPQRVK